MTNKAGLSKEFLGAGLLMIAFLMTASASADCTKDLRGEVYCGAGQCMADRDGIVWCSRYDDGDAVRTEGQVLCGKGQSDNWGQSKNIGRTPRGLADVFTLTPIIDPNY